MMRQRRETGRTGGRKQHLPELEVKRDMVMPRQLKVIEYRKLQSKVTDKT